MSVLSANGDGCFLICGKELATAAQYGALDYAERHLAVIERFGRFPHRNAALGRISTLEEEAYLREPGSGF